MENILGVGINERVFESVLITGFDYGELERYEEELDLESFDRFTEDEEQYAYEV